MNGGKNSVGFDEFMEMTDEQRDRLSVEELSDVQAEVDACKEDAKAADAALKAAILRRCEPLGRATLRQAGKDTGSVTLEAGEGFNYKFEIPKKVEWDQKLLRVEVEKLAAEGKNIDEYVIIEIKVSETKYNAWPSDIKKRFMAARTVKDGTVKAEIVEAKKK